MTLRTLFCVCVLMCVTQHSIADKGGEKCTKMDGRTDSQITVLRKHLLCNYDKHTAPLNSSFEDRVQVKVYLGEYRVTYKGTPGWGNTDTYNMMENTPNWFTLSTYVLMSWKDHRLQWNKGDYNDQTRINFERFEIWAPRVEHTCGNHVIFAESDGSITSFCWAQLIGNCRPVFFSWGDQRECQLSFKIEPTDKVQLHRENDTSSEEFDYYQMSKSASWSIVKAKRIFPLKAGQENADFVKINKQMPWKYNPSYFEAKVTIQKNFAIQDAAIFAPAAVLLTLLISSTWIPAKQEARVALLSITIIVQVIMFHQACRAMPFLAGQIVNIVGLYKDLIICSGAALVEWLIAYFIACREESSTRNMGTIAAPGPSIFSTLKTICVVSAKDSRGINRSLLLDRIFFLLLAITSFILVVVLGRRPPSLPFDQHELFNV